MITGQVMADKSDFRRLGEVLAGDLLENLSTEHEREVNALFQEQLALREELVRIVDLMQQEVLPREKQMHSLIEGMTTAYEAATKRMHEQISDHLRSGPLTEEQHEQRKQLVNPMQEMEDELKRIAEMLGHQVVSPDIQGWRAAGQPQTFANPLTFAGNMSTQGSRPLSPKPVTTPPRSRGGSARLPAGPSGTAESSALSPGQGRALSPGRSASNYGGTNGGPGSSGSAGIILRTAGIMGSPTGLSAGASSPLNRSGPMGGGVSMGLNTEGLSVGGSSALTRSGPMGGVGALSQAVNALKTDPFFSALRSGDDGRRLSAGLFNLLDRNHDGFITAAEWDKAFI